MCVCVCTDTVMNVVKNERVRMRECVCVSVFMVPRRRPSFEAFCSKHIFFTKLVRLHQLGHQMYVVFFVSNGNLKLSSTKQKCLSSNQRNTLQLHVSNYNGINICLNLLLGNFKRRFPFLSTFILNTKTDQKPRVQ